MLRAKKKAKLMVQSALLSFALSPLSWTWGADQSADEVAAELADPANALASMSLNFQYTSFQGELPGADSQGGSAVIFQPVLPFPVGDSNKNLILRPALMGFVSQPVFEPGKYRFDDEDWAMGDVTFDAVLAGASKSEVIFGWGVARTLPTGGSAVTGD